MTLCVSAAAATRLARSPRATRAWGDRRRCGLASLLHLLDRYPVRDHVVVGEVHCRDAVARRPWNHLAVQRQMQDLVVLDHESFIDELAPLFDVDLGLDLIDQ